MSLRLSKYVASTNAHLRFLLIIIATQAFELKEPFGVKMCEQLCLQISGCSFYTFSTSHLTCQVMVNNTATLQHGRVFEVGSKQGSIASMCPVKSRVLYIRRETRCQPYMNMVSEDSPKPHLIARVLVAPNELHEESHFYQLFLQNNTLGEYRFFYSVNVCSIAYSFNSNTLMVAMSKPNKIIAVPLGTTGNTTVARRFHVRSMAVDDDKGLLIVADVSNSNLYKLVGMKTNGGGIRNITQFTGPTFSAGSIALDTRRDMIYACYMSQIIAIKYTGETAVFVKHGKALVVAMALDIPRYMLYYQVNNEIRGTSLTGGEEYTIASISFLPLGMVYVNGVIFLTPMSGVGSIIALNMTDLSTKTIDTDYASKPGLCVCTLPQ